MSDKKLEEVDIILVTFERPHFLKHTIEKINERTLYPYNLIVVDNGSQDSETRDMLNRMEKLGDIQKRVHLDENLGLPEALNEGMKHVKNEYFITTQDDLIPPDLKPCWLERMLHLAKKYPDYGGIFMRIQRTARLHVDEDKDLINSPKSCAAVFRIQKRDDFRKLEKPFGVRKHWESHTFADTTKRILKKKTAMATKLYADHTGYMADNKGFKEGKTDYHTYSDNRVYQGKDKPYMDIDYRTQTPKKLNHPYDRHELKRMQEWLDDKGFNEEETNLYQQDVLGKYCKGRGLDIGCGKVRKCHPDAIGIDVYPYSDVVDIVHDASDLWMFKDDELDYIVGSHSLEHFPDTHKVIEEWYRVLKPGGHVALIVPDCELRPDNVRARGHKTGFTNEMLYQYFKGKFKAIRYGVLERKNVENTKPLLIYVGMKR